MENLFGNVISVYSRSEALSDGVLIDVTKLAKEAGFRMPVAVTSALWNKINEIPKSYSYQDKKGRLWDVLYMAALNARRSTGSVINYRIIMHHEVDSSRGKRIKSNIDLKAVCGPGDKGEPVITIMLLNED